MSQAKNWAHFPKPATEEKKIPLESAEYVLKNIWSETTWKCEKFLIATTRPECFWKYYVEKLWVQEPNLLIHIIYILNIWSFFHPFFQNDIGGVLKKKRERDRERERENDRNRERKRDREKERKRDIERYREI